MRRFFLPAAFETGNFIQISGQDVRHIKQVLRLKPGDSIEIADPAGTIGKARIERITPEHVTAYVESLITGGAEPPVSVILAQGLPKSDKMDFIIQKAVELGAVSIIPMQCEHSVVRYDAKKAIARVERWQSIACEAAKQSRRDIVPTVFPIRDLREVVSQCPQNTTILLLYEGKAPLCIGDALRQPTDSYLVLIGPEGGFSQSEVEFCQQHGAQCVTLGPRILRTETASLAALAIILYQCGDLGGLLCRK